MGQQCQGSSSKKYQQNETKIKFTLSYIKILPPEYNQGQVFDLFVEVLLNNKPLKDKDNSINAQNINPFNYNGQLQSLKDKNVEIECIIPKKSQKNNYFLTFNIDMHLKNLQEKKHKFIIDNPRIDISDFINNNKDIFCHQFDFNYGKAQGQLSFSIFRNLPQEKKYQHQDKYHEEVIIDKFSDLFRINKGWIFKYFPQIKQNQKHIRVISVIGMFSKGKSHISRKITNVDIAEGDHINTLGPSILYTENCKLIDSPGKGVPLEHKLLNSAQESEKEMLEKTITELFITEFCVESSKIIFFVVGLLSVFEQKDIMNIKAQYKEANLIVIHNFYELTTKKAIYQKIWEDIYFSFENVSAFPLPGIDTSKFFGYGFNSYIGDQPIRHLVLSNSFQYLTEFDDPDYFNLPVMQYIKAISPNRQIPDSDFIEQVIDSALKRSKTYLNIGKDIPEIQLRKQKPEMKEQNKFKILPKKQVKFDLKLAYEQNLNSQATNSQVTFSSSKYQPYYSLSFQQNQTQKHVLEMDLKIYATVVWQDFNSKNIKLEVVDDHILLNGSLKPTIQKYLKIDKTRRNTFPSQEFEIIINIPQYFSINNDKVSLTKFTLYKDSATQNDSENSLTFKLKAQKIPHSIPELDKKRNQTIKINFPENEQFLQCKPEQCNLLTEFKTLISSQQTNFRENQIQPQFQPQLNFQTETNTNLSQEYSQNLPLLQQTEENKDATSGVKQQNKQEGEYDLKFSFSEEYIDNETYFVFCVVYQTKNIIETLKSKQNWKIIGLTGSYKKGKSFIASKLRGTNVNHGFESSTTGIQIIIDQKRSTLILDTEGFERAINFYQNSIDESGYREINIEYDKAKKIEMIKFRNIFEDIVQNFILKYSDVILIVLSDLTFTDQQLLKTCYQNTPTNKQFIIVHNFLRYQAISHVKTKIMKEYNENIGNIWKYFNLEEHHITEEVINKYTTPEQRQYKMYNNYFLEQQKEINKDFNVYHTIIAREATEAGNYYNTTFLAFVQNQIDFVQNQLITSDVVTSFQEHLNEKISAFYKIGTKLDPTAQWKKIELEKNQLHIDYHYQKFPGKVDKQEFARLLREVKFYSVIEPPYFWTPKRKNNQMIIQTLVLSLPGGTNNYTDLKVEIRWNQGFQEIFITGKKKQSSSQQNEHVICTNSTEGNIELKLEIPQDLRILDENVKWKEGTSLAEIEFQSIENM